MEMCGVADETICRDGEWLNKLVVLGYKWVWISMGNEW